MSQVIKLKKGFDIHLQGKPQEMVDAGVKSHTYAVMPGDFHGLTPKLLVEVDDKVQIGTPLFADKYAPEIVFTSPVSGKVLEIVRGERRRLLEVVISTDGKNEAVEFVKEDPLKLEATAIKENILKSGLWPAIIRRPYGIIAKSSDTPKSIFISTFDSAPLAPDYQFLLKNAVSSVQTGINALSKLTKGKVYVGLKSDVNGNIFAGLKNAELFEVSGPHPAGNTGVHIHHLDPINKGDVVWTVNIQEVAAIGKLFESGKYDSLRFVAAVGPELKQPKYCLVNKGVKIDSLLAGGVNDGLLRYVSGNVLTGSKVEPKHFLGYYHYQLSVIQEGNEPEFFGWALPGFGKLSLSRTFFSWLTPKKEYKLDANLHGGHRPFVVSGEYEKVVPMDLLPVNLLKSIIYEDIDQMEQLGIYEVIEEDLALCEVVCTSKTEVQTLLRKGLDLMVKEVG